MNKNLLTITTAGGAVIAAAGAPAVIIAAGLATAAVVGTVAYVNSKGKALNSGSSQKKLPF
jgi:hypothetical protein